MPTMAEMMKAALQQTLSPAEAKPVSVAPEQKLTEIDKESIKQLKYNPEGVDPDIAKQPSMPGQSMGLGGRGIRSAAKPVTSPSQQAEVKSETSTPIKPAEVTIDRNAKVQPQLPDDVRPAFRLATSPINNQRSMAEAQKSAMTPVQLQKHQEIQARKEGSKDLQKSADLVERSTKIEQAKKELGLKY